MAKLSSPIPFDAIIALGSNVGDKAGNISRAIAALTAGREVELIEASPAYRTAPWGNTEQDWFVNAAISVRTTLGPEALLARCLDVERQLGRVRTEKWGPRIIDLDVLIYRGVEMATPDLVLPHPYLTERAFVLRPLADIAPDLVVKGRTISAWLQQVPHDDVVPLT